MPLLTDSTIDKISLFKCVRPKEGLPPFSKRKEFGAWIKNQLPAFADFLDQFTIPPTMQTTDEAQRCGVDTYRNPEIQQMLHENSPDHRFFEALKVIFTQAPTSPESAEPIRQLNPITGTSTEIFAKMLARNSIFTKSAVSGVQACGTYLTRLVKNNQYPVSVDEKHAGRRVYTINL
jgi:hypothetical protein